MADQPNSTPAATDGSDEKPINPKLLIPKNDGALLEVARLVMETWGLETWFTLRWKTQAEFAALYTTLAQSITDKRSAATSRTPQSQRLQELDDEMDEGLRFLKKYVEEENGYNKAKTDARLPGFGLVPRKGGGLGLDIDRDERRDALRDLLLPAVKKAAFKNRPYGTDFWQTRYDEYKTLLENADGLAGTVTKSVSKKDEAKKELRRVLQAVVYALRANFPDIYAAELRAWGFRKVSY
ncbi:hypothetical protein Q5H93_15260 [Hymenobacter sp. ASUV-10]|uniref:Uncharacterized protein n=1 Tax=Hymenobacter aranciens TaxID=3063996 RepID=A0ABT9BHF9_9BACT|nr:hypothetical protein [Hymenobacter sp. ASUV-10]MDO7876101.1 hypothetical protein [Hymenobacter sp. ASUV-10]